TYDKELHERMIQRVKGVTEKYTGLTCTTHSGSTDCNAPMSMGVPAVCVGTYRGWGTHTREEYVERASFETGMKITIDLMLQYYNE
ncbi:MAG: peptidase, partial [Clostridia bacterium]|nr:peptidase [Clostridia bacterium]